MFSHFSTKLWSKSTPRIHQKMKPHGFKLSNLWPVCIPRAFTHLPPPHFMNAIFAALQVFAARPSGPFRASGHVCSVPTLELWIWQLEFLEGSHVLPTCFQLAS